MTRPVLNILKASRKSGLNIPDLQDNFISLQGTAQKFTGSQKVCCAVPLGLFSSRQIIGNNQLRSIGNRQGVAAGKLYVICLEIRIACQVEIQAELGQTAIYQGLDLIDAAKSGGI